MLAFDPVVVRGRDVTSPDVARGRPLTFKSLNALALCPLPPLPVTVSSIRMVVVLPNTGMVKTGVAALASANVPCAVPAACDQA